MIKRGVMIIGELVFFNLCILLFQPCVIKFLCKRIVHVSSTRFVDRNPAIERGKFFEVDHHIFYIIGNPVQMLFVCRKLKTTYIRKVSGRKKIGIDFNMILFSIRKSPVKQPEIPATMLILHVIFEHADARNLHIVLKKSIEPTFYIVIRLPRLYKYFCTDHQIILVVYLRFHVGKYNQ